MVGVLVKVPPVRVNILDIALDVVTPVPDFGMRYALV